MGTACFYTDYGPSRLTSGKVTFWCAKTCKNLVFHGKPKHPFSLDYCYAWLQV